MITTTTHTIQGREIYEYIDIVTGDAIVGAHLFKDLFAGIRDIVGGRSKSYEKTMLDAKNTAIREMKDRAKTMGADAIVGIDLDYLVMGHSNGMMMVSANGTAVKLK